MQITYLGHAGFLVETKNVIIIIDPWLTPDGAFDNSWFQYPCNHFMIDTVKEKLLLKKHKFLYVSHEHKDHFDENTLDLLDLSDVTIILAKYRHNFLVNYMKDLSPKDIILLDDSQELTIIDNIKIVLYIVDQEHNRDSAILIKDNEQSFLNLNDCKINDRLNEIKEKYGKVNVFTMQFSGAVWHPTCYKYSKDKYKRICEDKIENKFKSVKKAISDIKPDVYLPSAGPPVFLDPLLYHINFEEINIYPRSEKIIKYLEQYKLCSIYDIQPGDVYDLNGKYIQNFEKISDFNSYMNEYKLKYKDFFDIRNSDNLNTNVNNVFELLKKELEIKVKQLKYNFVNINLYWGFYEIDNKYIEVNFKNKTTNIVNKIPEKYYKIITYAWQVNKVLLNKITWEDFYLTFRVSLERNPDEYQELINGFIMLNSEDISIFEEKVIKSKKNSEKFILEIDDKKYNISRYCPHQGGDLKQGWIEDGKIVCPRHRWKFDLNTGKKCNDENYCIFTEIIDW